VFPNAILPQDKTLRYYGIGKVTRADPLFLLLTERGIIQTAIQMECRLQQLIKVKYHNELFNQFNM